MGEARKTYLEAVWMGRRANEWMKAIGDADRQSSQVVFAAINAILSCWANLLFLELLTYSTLYTHVIWPCQIVCFNHLAIAYIPYGVSFWTSNLFLHITECILVPRLGKNSVIDHTPTASKAMGKPIGSVCLVDVLHCRPHPAKWPHCCGGA